MVKDTIGHCEPDVFADFDLHRRKIVEACRSKLSEYSDPQFLVLVYRDFEDPDGIRKDWQDFKGDEIRTLRERKPPWYAAGFGRPEYEADFAYWAQYRYFSHHEALMLTLGLEPKHFTKEQIRDMMDRQKQGIEIWSPLQYMIGRREQIERQFPMYGDSGRIEPDELFDWIKMVDLEVHPKFTSQYCTSVTRDKAGSKQVTPPKPHKREVDTISQLFTAMAIEYYGYDPKEPRSPIPKEIVELAASMGIEITDDTVRKYL